MNSNRSTIQIANRSVGPDNPMFLIAEVGLAHDGSLGAAHAFVSAAAETGVDAIKFQTHIATEESSRYEQFRVKVFPQDATRFDYWQRTAFEKSQWLELADHCRELGIQFLSSPFSELAVEWLLECNVPAWKVASGEVTNLPLLKKMASTDKPVLLSSGMSSWNELTRSVDYLQSLEARFGLFQCTTAYPCPPETWGLNVIEEMATKYGCPVGLSDHSGTIYPGLAARMLGASMLEFHVVFNKQQFGPDTKASLTFEQTSDLVKGVRSIETALKHPVDKDEQAASKADLKQMFSKSLYARTDIDVGTRLTVDHLDVRKPLIGLPASEMEGVIGKCVRESIKTGEPIHSKMLDQ